MLCARLAGKEIEKATQGIYPLQNTAIRKVKILRAPKFDLTKLLEVHGDYSEEAGTKVGFVYEANLQGCSSAV